MCVYSFPNEFSFRRAAEKCTAMGIKLELSTVNPIVLNAFCGEIKVYCRDCYPPEASKSKEMCRDIEERLSEAMLNVCNQDWVLKVQKECFSILSESNKILKTLFEVCCCAYTEIETAKKRMQRR